VEMNAGQMVEDVRLSLGDRVPVDFYGTLGGAVPAAELIVERIMRHAR
jgi:2-oxoglutarate/2-oxoacid ferredoxin oxidoreductase subunit alpha